MRIVFNLGIAAALALMVGCSTAASASLEDREVGAKDPAEEGSEEEEGSGTEDTTQAADPAAPPSAETPATPMTPPADAPKPKSKMTFFVTSTGNGNGGNFGGLAGADKKCQDLATAVNGGDHTWHAYLSAQGAPAKDRIGPGPWTNQKGVVVANDVASLHALGFNIKNADIVDEKGAALPANRSNVVTGSNQDGTPTGQTCANWTSNQNNQNARLGDTKADTSVVLGVSWNDKRKNSNCSNAGLNGNQSDARVYCFAID